MPYRKATLEDLKTAKEVYHLNPYHPNVYSLIKLNYKGLSEKQIKSLKEEIFRYFSEGKIYVKQ